MAPVARVVLSEVPVRQSALRGPEDWAKRVGLVWSWWDAWFCLVAVADHAADLTALDAVLVSAAKSPLGGGGLTEAKLSHLDDLRGRLAGAGLSVQDLTGPELIGQRGVLARARKRVWGDQIERSAWTEPMVNTPRVRLEERARRGYWPAFPVSPSRFYPQLGRWVERHAFGEGDEAFEVISQFDDLFVSLNSGCESIAERLALHRAAHTALLELHDQADDSYGVIGDEREEVWEAYLAIDWRAAGMAPVDYRRDVVELVVWEDYGLGWKDPSKPWQKVRGAEVGLVEAALSELEAELRRYYLDHQAIEASRHLGLLRSPRRRASAGRARF